MVRRPAAASLHARSPRIGRARARRPGAAAFVLVLALAGCSALPNDHASPTTVPVVLWFDNYRDVFEGSATVYGHYHGSTLDLVSRGKNHRCVGATRTRAVPPDANPPRHCEGIRGDAHLSCSDGREMTFSWSAEEGCGRGYGEGYDTDGHALRMSFGGSASRALMIAEDAVAAGRRLPPLPVAGSTGGGAPSPASYAMTTGTAFFVTWEGHLVTNHHVVRDATRVQVQLGDGEFVDAKILEIDAANDLALLHVEAIQRPLAVQPTSSVVRGEEVFTLGYPMIALQGQEQKATFGRVNASTGMQGDARFTQIDVPIQPGNSGGPLIDTQGDVIGVVTSMLHPRAAMETAGVVPQNVNYALKSEYVHAILESEFPDGWKAERWAVAKRDYSELVSMAESSVVLVRTW